MKPRPCLPIEFYLRANWCLKGLVPPGSVSRFGRRADTSISFRCLKRTSVISRRASARAASLVDRHVIPGTDREDPRVCRAASKDSRIDGRRALLERPAHLRKRGAISSVSDPKCARHQQPYCRGHETQPPGRPPPVIRTTHEAQGRLRFFIDEVDLDGRFPKRAGP